MNVTRKNIFSMSMPYAVATVRLDGRDQVIAATEDYGKMILTRPPEWTARELLPGPGGCMSIAQPEGSEDVYTIFGCFPGYKFTGAGVYRIAASGGVAADGPGTASFTEAWSPSRGAPEAIQGSAHEARRIFPLPFAHRICFVKRGGIQYLIAANLAEHKDSPTDWSRPGTVYAVPVPANSGKETWKPVPIFENLYKNHCMFVGTLHGRRVFMVGGVQGLFSYDLDAAGAEWKRELVLEGEISEVVVFDIDGDGVDELVTIEPFHGDRLYVYRKEGSGWKREAELQIAFGHGVWAGTIAGKRALIVGNRAGTNNLDIVIPHPGAKLTLERRVLAEGVGPANVAVVEHEQTTWIVATNQAESSVTAYGVTQL
ncbi:MAG TPA: hypothetical protein VMW73_08720 [Spirochaetia bacterium]|nr:hypothetical protein [Spirochaetia bacterium]